jgi:hypothetical protein
MNVLFLTIVRVNDISERGIYTDLLREFKEQGRNVYIASPAERRYREPTRFYEKDGVHILNIKTLNIQKANLIEKGVGTLLLEGQYLSAIKKYYATVKFDLIIYSTPPITFGRVIRFIKKRDNAYSYLLLKDIFPQNAVDLGMIKKGSAIHRFFRSKEKKLYEISDRIGCMSPANVAFVLNHNKNINAAKVEVNPNSIEPTLISLSVTEKHAIRNRYNIPLDDIVFVYGGNLGKPQGIDFLIDVLKSNAGRQGRYFLIVGDGTEYHKLRKWMDDNNPPNACLLKGLPKADYDLLLAACNVGLIFLSKKFTIPNFPSRLLSYLEFKMPIIAATDDSTDIGKIVTANDFGRWCLSGDLEMFNHILAEFCGDISAIEKQGENGYRFMMDNYLVQHSYQTIVNNLKQ